jgi:hypothetical protein
LLGRAGAGLKSILGFALDLNHIAKAIQSIGKTETLHQKTFI